MSTVVDGSVTGGKPSKALPRVLLATTAMLTFVSFWRAAAIVLNDLASSAFYAGGIAEEAIGKSAPWFILAIMLFSYGVRSLYIESCSMFVRGGVYRVVKEAMGSTLAKFSVSALMFDYVLTGPISGVAAGQYLVGLLNDIFRSTGVHTVLPINTTAAAFALLVTLYFWWQNIKGIEESSDKALRIMYVTTAMVVLMIAWCCYTLIVRGGHLPPWPKPANLVFGSQALGWLKHSRIPHTIGLIGILIALGHSVLAMSGEETLAQVYREIEHPKLKNLEKAGFVIFIYSLMFTSLISFFAVMIIPDTIRPQFFGNLIGGLAMNEVGPYHMRLFFQAFVVVVGVLILAGAVNTAIVGSNGVLNRVSEDGILPEWFRQPHPRFGTSHHIINLVVILQISTIVLSRGNIIVLGEAYAFGVMWSFAMKGLAVLVLRYTEPGQREFRVPFNLHLGKLEIPLGLAVITITLVAMASINLFTKQIATVSGIAFTLIFFGIFTLSEKITHHRRTSATEGLDQFHLVAGDHLSPQTLCVRPGNIIVMVRDYNAIYNLGYVLQYVNPARQDVVVLHIRLLARAASGEHGLDADQLFTYKEQELFTRALNVAEKNGKTIHLAVVPATDKWDGMMLAAHSLKAASIVVGLSHRMPATEEARLAGLAWERLSSPRPQISLEIWSPTGTQNIFYLGPHAPHLTPKEVDDLHRLWLEVSCQLGMEEIHHHDIVHFAITQLGQDLRGPKHKELLKRLRQYLEEIRPLRPPGF